MAHSSVGDTNKANENKNLRNKHDNTRIDQVMALKVMLRTVNIKCDKEFLTPNHQTGY